MFAYELFSLRVESNREIPDVVGHSAGRPPDLRLTLGHLPPQVQRYDRAQLAHWHCATTKESDGRPMYTIWALPGGSQYLLEYLDGHRFVFDRRGTELWGEWPSDSTLADNLTYVLGPVFGILLSLRGLTCLHASALRIGDGCVLIVGGAEAGKSTTAAALVLRGHALLTDDIATLEARDGKFVVRPAYPRIRLWPGSAPMIGMEADRLPPLTPNWDKRYLDLRDAGLSFSTQPVPLRAVYVMRDREEQAARPYLSEASPREAFLDLIANVYVAQLPDEGRSQRDFPVLHRLLARLPVRRLHPHADPARLPHLCELIESDVAARAAYV